MADERKPVAWITRGGKHIPIYADRVSEDEKKKEREIGQNEAEGNEKNNESIEKTKGKYAQLNDVFEMCRQFSDDTGITTSYDVKTLKSLDKQTFGTALDTIAKWKKEYGDKLGVNSVYVWSDEQFKQEHETEHANAKDIIAVMSLQGNMTLNPRFFRMSPQELNQVAKAGVEDRYHPTGDMTSFITHEIGHAVLFQKFKDAYSRINKQRRGRSVQDIIDYNTAYSIIEEQGVNWKPEYEEKNGGTNWLFTRYCMDKMDDFEALLQRDSVIDDWYVENGGMRFGAMGLVNPILFSNKLSISTYASEDYFEMMAEAFQDVKDNGNNAHYMSKVVYDYWYDQEF